VVLDIGQRLQAATSCATVAHALTVSNPGRQIIDAGRAGVVLAEIW
jgi:hypothetical protein